MRLHREARNQEDFWVKTHQPWQGKLILFHKPWQGEKDPNILHIEVTNVQVFQIETFLYLFHIGMKKYISHWKICSPRYTSHTMWKNMDWFWFLTCIWSFKWADSNVLQLDIVLKPTCAQIAWCDSFSCGRLLIIWNLMLVLWHSGHWPMWFGGTYVDCPVPHMADIRHTALKTPVTDL